jgi:guanidinoacetate N-methyltransferase
MIRRLKRTADFELSLSLKRDDFVNPPRESQRNWILNRLILEFTSDLYHLDEQARSYVPGASSASLLDRRQADLTDNEIMEDWQIPVMRAMAAAVCANHGHILEIGFGRGIASDFIQAHDPDVHTIIECNDSVIERYNEWVKGYPDRDIRMIHSMWQDAVDEMVQYDGIFFHTYPMSEEEFEEHVAASSTFAEHFFPVAAAHLVDGGLFSYLTIEADSLSRSHQRALFRHFTSFELSKVESLDIPADTADAMWSSSMVIVKAIK